MVRDAIMDQKEAASSREQLRGLARPLLLQAEDAAFKATR
jgi:hypothetical protein